MRATVMILALLSAGCLTDASDGPEECAVTIMKNDYGRIDEIPWEDLGRTNHTDAILEKIMRLQGGARSVPPLMTTYHECDELAAAFAVAAEQEGITLAEPDRVLVSWEGESYSIRLNDMEDIIAN